MSKGQPDYQTSAQKAADAWNRVYSNITDEAPNMSNLSDLQKIHNMYENQQYLSGLSGSTLGRQAETSAMANALLDRYYQNLENKYRRAQSAFQLVPGIAQQTRRPSALENIGTLGGAVLGGALAASSGGGTMGGAALGGLGSLLSQSPQQLQPSFMQPSYNYYTPTIPPIGIGYNDYLRGY